MKKKILLLMLILITGFMYNVNAYAREKNEKREKAKIFSLESKYKTGLIFNVNDILLDVESYQGGLGIKRFFKDKYAYRGSLDFSYSNSSNSIVIELGNTIEKHLAEGRVSPYIGGLLDIGLYRYKTEIDSDNWTVVTSIPVSAGPVFGVEVILFDFLSLFAEYALTVDFTRTTTKTSTAGNVTTDTDNDFGTDIGIGNESKIGIVLYFTEIKKGKKK